MKPNSWRAISAWFLLVSFATAQGPDLELTGRVDGVPLTGARRRMHPGHSHAAISLDALSAGLLGSAYALGVELVPPGSFAPGMPAQLGSSAFALLNTIGGGALMPAPAPTLAPSVSLDLPIPAGAPSGMVVAFQGLAIDASSPFGYCVSSVVPTILEGLPTMTQLVQPTVGILGQFAIEMIVADLEDDGVNEFIIGARGADAPGAADAGIVYVYRGANTVADFVLHDPIPEVGAEFGVSLAVGDINGDGHRDLVIGARESDIGLLEGAGEAFVFFGPDYLQVLTLTDVVPTGRSQFGGWVACGDVDGDGYDDVAVAAIAHPVGSFEKEGQITVFYGPSLFAGTIISNPTPGTAGRFGYRVVLEDFDQDGFDDLAASQVFAGLLPGGTDRSGSIHLFPGPFLNQHIFVPNPNPTLTSQGLMGADMVAADMNDDGYPDLVVGAELDAFPGLTGQGSVMLLRGPDFQTLDYVNSPIPTVNEAFGSGVGAGDFDGDGFQDLFVGAFWYQRGSVVQAGRAHLLYGPDYLQFETFVEPATGTAYQFGRRVRGGDLDGDGRAEMLIGAPFSSITGVSRAGAMYVVRP